MNIGGSVLLTVFSVFKCEARNRKKNHCNINFNNAKCFCYRGTRLCSWLRHCIKPGGRGFCSWWCNSNFSFTVLLESTQRLTEMSTRNISWGLMRPVRMSDNLTTFMYQLSWNMGTSSSWIPQGLRWLSATSAPSKVAYRIEPYSAKIRVSYDRSGAQHVTSSVIHEQRYQQFFKQLPDNELTG